jgi:hypothetical protein
VRQEVPAVVVGQVLGLALEQAVQETPRLHPLFKVLTVLLEKTEEAEGVVAAAVQVRLETQTDKVRAATGRHQALLVLASLVQVAVEVVLYPRLVEVVQEVAVPVQQVVMGLLVLPTRVVEVAAVVMLVLQKTAAMAAQA